MVEPERIEILGYRVQARRLRDRRLSTTTIVDFAAPAEAVEVPEEMIATGGNYKISLVRKG